MFDQKDTESAAAFAREFLGKYISVGFGALSKREVDLLLIQLLQKHFKDFRDKSDFDAALLLRSTKRKIRGLRDEVSFREAKDEEFLQTHLRNELKRAEVLPGDHGVVKLQLDDAVLRGYAEKIVRTEFGIVDSSFNSAILQLSGEKYLLLCLTVLTSDEQKMAKQVLVELNQGEEGPVGSQRSLYIQFKEAFVWGAGQHAGKLCVSGAMALVTGGASIVLEGVEPIVKASRGMSDALKEAWNHFTQHKGTD